MLSVVVVFAFVVVVADAVVVVVGGGVAVVGVVIAHRVAVIAHGCGITVVFVVVTCGDVACFRIVGASCAVQFLIQLLPCSP